MPVNGWVHVTTETPVSTGARLYLVSLRVVLEICKSSKKLTYSRLLFSMNERTRLGPHLQATRLHRLRHRRL